MSLFHSYFFASKSQLSGFFISASLKAKRLTNPGISRNVINKRRWACLLGTQEYIFVYLVSVFV